MVHLAPMEIKLTMEKKVLKVLKVLVVSRAIQAHLVQQDQKVF